MAENGDIELIVTLDDGSVVKGLASAEDAAKKSASAIEGTYKQRIGRGFSFLSGRVVALGATIATVFAGRAILEAAQRQEDAVNQLNNSLRSAGTFSEEASLGIQRFATALQGATTLGDELILEQVALARNFTRTNEEAQRLTEAAVELSAATGISLDSAVKNLGKTFGGLTGELGESVPALRNLTKEQLQAGEAIDFVLDRFGGSAAAQVNTFSGAVTQLSNVFGDLLEEIGFVITKSPVVVETFKFISAEIQRLIKGFGNIQSSSQDIFKPIVLSAIDVSNFFVSTLGPVVDIVNTIFNRLGKTIGGVAAAIVQLVSGEFSEAAETFKQTLGDAFALTLDTNVTETAISVLDRYKNVIQAVSGAQRELASTTEQSTQKIIQQTDKLGESITKLSEQIVVGAIASLGASLVQGGKAFSNFGKTVANIMGDFFIKLGTTIIASSKAVEAIKLQLTNFFAGPIGIAAGVALIAAGGALKAFAGGPAAVSGAGSDAGSVPTTSDSVADAVDGIDEVEQRGPSVAVTIQGNVLDRRETGLELAEVIREAFDGNGVVFNT